MIHLPAMFGPVYGTQKNVNTQRQMHKCNTTQLQYNNNTTQYKYNCDATQCSAILPVEHSAGGYN